MNLMMDIFNPKVYSHETISQAMWEWLSSTDAKKQSNFGRKQSENRTKV
jgi:hypothetical protein